MRTILSACVAALVMLAGCQAWTGIKDNADQFGLVRAAVQQGARLTTFTLLQREGADARLAARVETGAGFAASFTQAVIDDGGTVDSLDEFLEAVDTHLDPEVREIVVIGFAAAAQYLSAAIEETGKLDKRDLELALAAFAGLRAGAQDYLALQILGKDSP